MQPGGEKKKKSPFCKVPACAVENKGISQHFRAEWRRGQPAASSLNTESHWLRCKWQKCQTNSQTNICRKMSSGQLRTLGSALPMSVASVTSMPSPPMLSSPSGSLHLTPCSLALSITHTRAPPAATRPSQEETRGEGDINRERAKGQTPHPRPRAHTGRNRNIT